MSLFENTIRALSPKWAAERAHYRTILDMADQLQLRKYDAAARDRRTKGWYAPGTGPNAELSGAAARIRDRGRDLVRNNPFASVVPRKVATAIIGTGAFPRLASPDAKLRQKAKDNWDRFVDNADSEGLTDFYAQQHVGSRTFVEAGEHLVRWTVPPRKQRTPKKFPLQCAILEPDFLDSSKTQALPDGGVIIQGVQFDANGRREGYWLFPEHPGESVQVFTRRIAESQFVSVDWCDHVLDQLRPGQARGVSMFAAAALTFRDIEEYKDAEMLRRKIAACFAVFRRPPQGAIGAPMTRDTGTDGKGNTITNINPGAVYDLGAGEDVSFAQPPRVESLADVLRFELQAVSAGTGTTYEMVTGDLSGVNFSSMRIGRNDFLDVRDHWRWHAVVPMHLRPALRRVGMIATVTGDWNLDDGWSSRWVFPADRLMSPTEDIEAAKDQARATLGDPMEIIARMSGEDPADVIEGQRQLNKMLDDAGIISDMDPRNVGRSSTPNPQATSTAKTKALAE